MFAERQKRPTKPVLDAGDSDANPRLFSTLYHFSNRRRNAVRPSAGIANCWQFLIKLTRNLYQAIDYGEISTYQQLTTLKNEFERESVMRQPNFKLGWFIPNQIAALTHPCAEITSDDFMGIVQSGQNLLAHVENEFHVIIDNRFVSMASLASLDQMKQAIPYMNHPFLRWIAVVKPQNLTLNVSELPIEKDGLACLKNFADLPEAIKFLKGTVSDVQWQYSDAAFFPNINLGG